MPPSYPPHTAIRVFSSAVVKSVCWFLASGNEGGLQSLVLGNTSLEERRPPSPHPPVKRTMVSSLAGGASVAGPGCLVLWCWLSFVVNHSDNNFIITKIIIILITIEPFLGRNFLHRKDVINCLNKRSPRLILFGLYEHGLTTWWLIPYSFQIFSEAIFSQLSLHIFS